MSTSSGTLLRVRVSRNEQQLGMNLSAKHRCAMNLSLEEQLAETTACFLVAYLETTACFPITQSKHKNLNFTDS